MIPGDGVGPEIMDSVQNVVKSVGAPIEFEVMHLSEVICFHFCSCFSLHCCFD